MAIVALSADTVREKVRSALSSKDRATVQRWIERYNVELDRWHSVDALIHTSESTAYALAEAYRLRGWAASVRKVARTVTTYHLMISLA